MKATDFRDMTFLDLQRYVNKSRRDVYEAWLLYGSCTTAELAASSGMSILNIRPRTTDLLQCGLVELDTEKPGVGNEGRYRAVSMSEWKRRREAAPPPPKPEQSLMEF